METLKNYVDNQWKAASGGELVEVINPATGEGLVKVPMSQKHEVDAATQAASRALPGWRATPVGERIQFLFKWKHLLEEQFEEIARGITIECGKTLDEARGELRRGVENVEVACGTPSLIQGYLNEDIAPGIDELMIRQPVGVVAIISPFNFPAMIPLWFLPYAIACGNTVVLKPSERVPQTLVRLVEGLVSTGLPPGVVNLVHGGKEAVDAILTHPDIKAVSFVGSTPVARYVYSTAAAHGKRAQCQGGAKNPVIVLPDADLEMTTKIVADSAFGCAGQRCLAASLAITVGDARKTFTEAIAETAKARVVGNGLDPGTQMGPVINQQSKDRILGLIKDQRLLVDGRQGAPERGSFLKPSIIDDLDPGSELAATEIFGPVLSLIHLKTMDEVIELINKGRYGNMASLFTSSGSSARRFRNQAEVGNVGINIGVAAPMAFFPFSGWKDSFFGDLHAQGRHGIEFYTQTKVVVERWPREWSRQF